MDCFFQSFSAPVPLFSTICGVLAVACLLLQAYVWREYYWRVVRYRKSSDAATPLPDAQLPPASVVVYACDNAESLRRNIPALFDQDYPDFEVVIVDDASTDDTPEVIQMLMNTYPRLYATRVPADACALSRKKLALTLGIKAVKNDCVALLDANCEPASPHWLRNTMRHFADGADVVIGYSRYEAPDTFADRYRLCDRLLFSLRYLSCAVRRTPFMAEGTNLAYRKSLFFDHKGFGQRLNLRYGDDDLFVNEVAAPGNTRVEISPESFVTVRGDDFVTMWRLQKMRYSFTAPYLQHDRQALFAGEQAAVYLFYAAWAGMLAAGICYPAVLLAALLLLLLRGALLTVVFRKLCRLFGEPSFGLNVLLYEWARPLTNAYYRLLARFRRDENKTWHSVKV